MSETTFRNLIRLGASASIATFLAAIWINSFLPFQDYPEWLFQARLIHQLITDRAQSDFGYALQWFPLKPNILVSLLLTGLQYVVPVAVAGKILLTSIVLAFVFGWRFLLQKQELFHPLRWMGIPLAFNYFFYLGFLSYCFAIGLLMFAVGWLYSEMEVFTLKKSIVAGVLALVLYLAHGVAFGVFAISVAVFLLMQKSYTRAQKLLVVGMFLPAAVLLALYFLYGEKSSSVMFYDSILYQIISSRYAFSIFHRLIPFDPVLPVSYLNVAVLAVLAWIAIRTWRGPHSANSRYRTLAWCMMGFVFLIPFQSIGEFYPPNPRFVLPAAAFFAASFASTERVRSTEMGIVAIGLMVVILHSVQLFAFNVDASRIANSIRPFLEKANLPIVVGPGYIEEFDKQPAQRFSGAVRTMVRYRRYAEMEVAPSYFRTFETGLLEKKTSDHAEVCALDSALESWQHIDEATSALRSRMNDVLKFVDCFVVIGTDQVLQQFRSELIPYFDEARYDKNVLVMVRRTK